MKVNTYCSYISSLPELISGMDSAGLDKSVLAAWPCGALSKGKALPDNKAVQDAVQKYPDRFIGCFYIEGLSPEAPRQVKQAAQSGCKAIVLFPHDGYAPDDRMLMPLLDEAAANKLAVFIQTGLANFEYATKPGARRAPESGLAYPMRLDPVCRLYPETNFLLMNMGYPLMMEAMSVCHNASNIYISLGDEGVRTTAPVQGYCGMGHSAFIPLPEDKLVFGSGQSQNIADSLSMFSCSAKRLFPGEDANRFLSSNPLKMLGIQGEV